MYLIRRKNGTYYINFFDQTTNQNRRISTGTKSKREAQTFLKNFNPSFETQKKLINLSKFLDEYIGYTGQNKTLKYVKSIKLSFRHLINIQRISLYRI